MPSTRPKVKDYLEILSKTLNKLDKRLDNIQLTDERFIEKLEDIERFEIPIDKQDFEEVNRRFKSIFEQFGSIVGQLDQKKEEIKDVLREKQDQLWRFYLLIGAFFLITVGSVWFLAKTYEQKKALKQEFQKSQNINREMYEFIQNLGLSQEFEKSFEKEE